MAIHTLATTTAPRPTLPRLTEEDADWRALHAATVRRLSASLRRYVRDLRASQHPETLMADFIARHTRLLAEAYATGHREGAKDYYATVSLKRAPRVGIEGQRAKATLAFYAPSVAKMAREGVEAARQARMTLAEGGADSITLFGGYDESQHPRGYHGHWIETTGGVHEGEGEGGGGGVHGQGARMGAHFRGAGGGGGGARGGAKAKGEEDALKPKPVRTPRAPKNETAEERAARLQQAKEARDAARASRTVDEMHQAAVARRGRAAGGTKAEGEGEKPARAPKAPKAPKTPEQLHAERLAKAEQKAADATANSHRVRADLTDLENEYMHASGRAQGIEEMVRVENRYRPQLEAQRAAAGRAEKAAMEARMQAASVRHEMEGVRQWEGNTEHPPFSPHEFEAAKFKPLGEASGVNDAYTTTINGQKYLIKRASDDRALGGDARYEVHAEAAATEVAHLAGFDSTTARAYAFEHEGEHYVAVEWKDAKPIGFSDAAEARLVRGVSDEQFSQLALHEYVMGDGDRHGGNLLYDPKTHQAYQIDFGRGMLFDFVRPSPTSAVRDAWTAKHAKGRDGRSPWERMRFSREQIERVVHAEPEIIRTMHEHGLDRGISSMRQRIEVLRTLLRSPDPTYADLVQTADAVLQGGNTP